MGLKLKTKLLTFNLENKTIDVLYNPEKYNLFEEKNKDTFITLHLFWYQKI